MRVSVHLWPGPERFAPERAAIVVDVLRATTSLSFALAAGAAKILPATSPEEALRLKREHPDAWLCGEREGLRIPGFDLGNSPAEYERSAVAGRTLIFASTNGSLAMDWARPARRIVLAAFVNAAAAIERNAVEARVSIVCAGKLGAFALEDAACAGWLCARLESRGATLEGAGARLARSLAPEGAGEVRALLQGSAHGRYLRGLGPAFALDVERCADVDVLDRAFEL